MLDWVDDIDRMQHKFGFYDAIAKLSDEDLKRLLKFRMDFQKEEHDELQDAYVTGNAEEIVDALIDTCVVAIGTLLLFGVHADTAWARVHKANMTKQRGVKEGRPNPLNLPDLMKPDGWKPPDHTDNHGLLDKVFP